MENKILWKQIMLNHERFNRVLYYDSLKLERIEVESWKNAKLEKRAARRLKWAIALGSVDGLLLFLLIK